MTPPSYCLTKTSGQITMTTEGRNSLFIWIPSLPLSNTTVVSLSPPVLLIVPSDLSDENLEDRVRLAIKIPASPQIPSKKRWEWGSWRKRLNVPFGPEELRFHFVEMMEAHGAALHRFGLTRFFFFGWTKNGPVRVRHPIGLIHVPTEIQEACEVTWESERKDEVDGNEDKAVEEGNNNGFVDMAGDEQRQREFAEKMSFLKTLERLCLYSREAASLTTWENSMASRLPADRCGDWPRHSYGCWHWHCH